MHTKTYKNSNFNWKNQQKAKLIKKEAIDIPYIIGKIFDAQSLSQNKKTRLITRCEKKFDTKKIL